MKHLLLAALLCFSPRVAQSQAVVNFGYFPIGQMRFLYAHMQTEFAGCLYGERIADTVEVRLFLPSFTDPRLAADSAVFQGSCFRGVGDLTIVGIVHSHLRGGYWNCVPSGFSPADAVPPRKDRSVLLDWLEEGVLFGAIMCARGDSLVVYGRERHHVIALPPLDSLYGALRP